MPVAFVAIFCRRLALVLIVSLGIAGLCRVAGADVTPLNASYDPTRELYAKINEAFAAEWQAKTGEAVTIEQSHGGSGKQARSVIDGLRADVVTLALAADIDAIAKKSNLLPANWASRLPNNSVPYSSTIVFLVRKGNPKGIQDWGDLVRPGISVITPNPRTSGGARWNFLAAWAWGRRAYGSDEARVRSFATALYANTPMLDTSARGAMATFAQRGIGDVLIAWESDAFVALDAFGADQFMMVAPSLSITAETPVALIDENARANGTEKVARAWLEFLYSPAAQKIAAHHYFRPYDTTAADPADLARFAKIDCVTIDGEFGGWARANTLFFASGALFDQIYRPVN